MSQSDSRERMLEQHVAEGRKIVDELVRKLAGSPGIDVMRGLVISDARKWLDDTRWVPR